jgi:hypothetical protein
LEQLIQFTNSEDFNSDWAFFATGFNLTPRTDTMIISLEALYDGFDEKHFKDKKSWKIACNGFFAHRLYAGYLRPFYQLKILSTHPLLWNYGTEAFFSVHGSCKDIALLMGELFLVHSEVSGNWVQFHDVFGSLPQILETKTENQLSAPIPLLQHYLNVFQRHGVDYTLNTTQQNQQELFALLFSNNDFSDSYDYGQPFVVAESFEIIEGA